MGDFNGDGYPDLAAGARLEVWDGKSAVGRVYVFLGSERGFQPWHSYGPEEFGLEAAEGMELGAQLAAGDFDADGFDDLAVSFGGLVADSPIAVGYGAATKLARTEIMKLTALDPAGSSASIRIGGALSAGDLNGDGVDDLAIGAPSYPTSGLTDAGAVLVATGSAGGLVQGYRVDLATLAVGPYSGDRFGASLDQVADALGGPSTLAVGMPGYGWVFRIQHQTLQNYTGTSIGLAGLGTRVAIGHIDGDGIPDIVASGTADSRMEIVLANTAVSSFASNGSREIHPLGLRDVDGDGFDDLLALSLPELATSHDSQVLLYGGTGTFVFDTLDELDAPEGEVDDSLGTCAAIHDVDGDGLVDVLLGAPADQSAAGQGRVQVLRVGSVDEWGMQPESFDVVDQELSSETCDICEVHDWSDGTVCDGGSGAEICVGGACVIRGCGDGYRQRPSDPWGRESCDDGNQLAGDACNPDCTAPLALVVASEPFMSDSPSRLPPSAGADGREHVLFVYVHDDGESRSLRARTYTDGGAPEQETSVSLHLANLPGVGYDPQATVAGLTSGGWVVVWTDPDLDGAGSGIAYRLVGTDGSLSPVYIANEDTRGEQLEPRVAALSSGFVVVWTDAGGFDGPLGRSLIEARRFSDTGAPLEDEWSVSDRELTSTQPALASNGDDFFVVWTDLPDAEGASTSLWARRFGAEEDATPFEVTANGMEASAAWLDYGLYVVSWTSRMTDYRGDIRLAMVSPTSTPLVYAEMEFAATSASETASSVGVSGDHCVVAYEVGGHRRGLAWETVNGTFPASESSTLRSHLTGQLEGDVTVAGTSRGLWFAWSDAGDTTTCARPRSVRVVVPRWARAS